MKWFKKTTAGDIAVLRTTLFCVEVVSLKYVVNMQ